MEAHSEPPASEPPTSSGPQGDGRRRFGWWPWVALVLLVAAVGGLNLGSWLGQQQAAPVVAGSTAVGARPTIVVVAASPAASPVRSPVAVASPAADRQYVVVTGDTLRTIAQQQYGDPAQWQRVYDANRDVIGSNPDALQAGMRLRIPAQ